MMTDRASATSALDAADRSSSLISRRALGLRWTMVAFSAATAAGLLLVGLGSRPVGILVGTMLIAAAGGAMGVVSATSSVLPPRFRRRYATTIAVWAILYMTALLVGLLALPGSETFWVVAAAACAAPGVWFALTTRAPR